MKILIIIHLILIILNVIYAYKNIKKDNDEVGILIALVFLSLYPLLNIFLLIFLILLYYDIKIYNDFLNRKLND